MGIEVRIKYFGKFYQKRRNSYLLILTHLFNANQQCRLFNSYMGAKSRSFNPSQISLILLITKLTFNIISFFHFILQSYSYANIYKAVRLQQKFKQMFQHQFDCKEIQAALPDYKYVKRLGSGAFAVVHLVQKRDTNEQLAVKKVSCFGMNEYEKQGAVNEAKILSELDHENVIKVKSTFFDEKEDIMYIFMQYAQSGDLSMLIQDATQKKKRIPEATIWKAINDISNGLQYLHRNQIVHRDLKPANIFRKDKFFKIGDMNVSKIMGTGIVASTKTGSPLYTAPEVWDSEQYNQKCDVWSLGVLVYQLCCLKVPFEADSIIQLMNRVRSQKPKSIPSFYSTSLDQLISRMLQTQPTKRVSAEQVLKISDQKLKKQTQGLGQEEAGNLMDTIVFPDTHHKWINLVPISFPPKTFRNDNLSKSQIEQPSSVKSISKEKSSKKSIKGECSNIFRSNQKRPPLNIPKSNSRSKIEQKKQERQQKKELKVPNLPPIYRSNSPVGSRTKSSSQKREGLSSSRSKRQSAIQLVVQAKSLISSQNGN